MTNDQLKQALFQKTPVLYNNIRYDSVNAIIYRVINNKLLVSAELQDKSKNSVTIAKAEDIYEEQCQ